MTWFKVDDTLHAHKKAMRAGTEAMGLWVLAGSWAASQLTDGWVPEYAAERLCPDAGQLAERLVRAGLWEQGEYDGDKGWWFHQWSERQPERADVVADRAANARKSSLYRDEQLVEAVKKRDRDRCRYCGTLINWRDRRSACGATFDHVETQGLNTLENVVVACRGCNSRKSGRPISTTDMHLLPPGAIGVGAGANQEGSRSATDSAGSYLDADQNDTSSDLERAGLFQVPVPSRPGPSSSSQERDTTGAGARRKPEHAIPDTWRPNDKHRKYASDHGIPDVTLSADRFRNHAHSIDRRLRDWDAGFRNWMSIEVERQAKQTARPNLRAVSGGHRPYQNPTDPDAYDGDLL